MPFHHPPTLGIAFAGILLMTGLLTGMWKYLALSRSPDFTAPVYVDIAHRAALMYAFAMLVAAALSLGEGLPESWRSACLSALMACFLAAIGSYALHGALRDTENQFARPHRLGGRAWPHWLVHGTMMLIGLTEIAATGLLLAGFLRLV